MSLKISKNIDIHPRKIGRNEPCPCNSGKKYKKCCLDKEKQYSPSTHKGQVSRVVDWATEQSFFKDFLEKKLKEIFKESEIKEKELMGLIEALIFEEKINDQTALEHFIKKAPLSDQECLMYQSWQEKSFFSIFEVIDVNIGKSLRLKNLIDKKDYLVLERMGTYQINKGMVIPCRLVPLKEFWMMGGGLQAAMPDNDGASYFLKRIFKVKPHFQVSELNFIKLFYGEKSEETETETEIKIKNLNHNQAKERLAELLKEKNISYQIFDLEEMILGKKRFGQGEVIAELSKQACSREELENWIALLHQYWQTHPKFQDKTIAPGPKEKVLLNQLMLEFQNQNLEIDKYPIIKANEIIKKFSKEWFDIPQEELAGKTAKMIIMEERESRGNANKELTYKFSFNQLDLSTSGENFFEKYNFATHLVVKEHQYLKALEIFSEIAPDTDYFLKEEKFRWYGKVGNCLMELGEIELGKKYFQKSLELNPNYEIGKKNLATINDSKKLDILKKIGFQQLFNSILEKQPIFEISGIKNCKLLKDVLFFLNYLDQNKVSLSAKQRNIQIKDVLFINKNLIHPDSEAIKIGEIFENYRSEWQFSKVDFLHSVLEIGGLCKDDGKNLVLRSSGKNFLNQTLEKQFSQIFIIWFEKVDWGSFENRNNRMNLLEPIRQSLQDQSWQILKTLKEFGLQRKFSKDEFSTNIFEFFEKKKEVQAQKFLIHIFLDKAIFDYLIWANIIAVDEQSKIRPYSEYNFGFPFVHDKFCLTDFGFALISSIEEKMKNIIPQNLRTLV